MVQNLIKDALKSHGADYVEIRIEDHVRTKISLRGRSTDELSTSRSVEDAFAPYLRRLGICFVQ